MPRLRTAANVTEVVVLRSSVVGEVVVIAIVVLLGGLLAYVPPPSESETGMSSAPARFPSQQPRS
jgi:hypothetical protein